MPTKQEQAQLDRIAAETDKKMKEKTRLPPVKTADKLGKDNSTQAVDAGQPIFTQTPQASTPFPVPSAGSQLPGYIPQTLPWRPGLTPSTLGGSSDAGTTATAPSSAAPKPSASIRSFDMPETKLTGELLPVIVQDVTPGAPVVRPRTVASTPLPSTSTDMYDLKPGTAPWFPGQQIHVEGLPSSLPVGPLGPPPQASVPPVQSVSPVTSASAAAPTNFMQGQTVDPVAESSFNGKLQSVAPSPTPSATPAPSYKGIPGDLYEGQTVDPFARYDLKIKPTDQPVSQIPPIFASTGGGGGGSPARMQIDSLGRLQRDVTGPVTADSIAGQAGSQAMSRLDEGKGAQDTAELMANARMDQQILQQKIDQNEEDKRLAYDTAREHYMRKSAELENQKIDPQRYFNSLSTFQKVIAGIGAMFGGLAAKGGVNPFMANLNQRINEDIDAQKQDIDNKRAGLSAAATGLKLNIDKYGSSEAAMLHQKADMWNQVVQHVQEIAQTTKSKTTFDEANAILAQAKGNVALANQQSAEYIAKHTTMVGGGQAPLPQVNPAHLAYRMQEPGFAEAYAEKVKNLIAAGVPKDRARVLALGGDNLTAAQREKGVEAGDKAGALTAPIITANGEQVTMKFKTPDEAKEVREKSEAFDALNNNLTRMQQLRSAGLSSFGESKREYDDLASQNAHYARVALGYNKLDMKNVPNLDHLTGAGMNDTTDVYGDSGLKRAQQMVQEARKGYLTHLGARIVPTEDTVGVPGMARGRN